MLACKDSKDGLPVLAASARLTITTAKPHTSRRSPHSLRGDGMKNLKIGVRLAIGFIALLMLMAV
ncbi:hypothetical protein ABTK05_20455, partial [Acinetobacter baumannii]